MAARAGHLGVITLLIENGGNIWSRNKRAEIPLHLVAQEGHATCVKILSKGEKIVDSRDKSGNPPLLLALRKGYHECVSALIQEGADPNLFYYLHRAVYTGDYKSIAALLKGGADINQLNDAGFSPLHTTINFSINTDFIKMLIKMGADLDLADECNYGKFRPIYRALYHKNFDLMMLLIENGVDLDKENGNIYYDGWRTPLHEAVTLKEYSTYIQPLIDGGADLTIQDKWGKTPLEAAKEAQNEKAIALLEAATVLDQKHPIENGSTALHKAVGKGDIQLVKKLITQGARVNRPTQCSLRFRPLHFAALINNVHIIELLIDHGAHVDAQDGWGVGLYPTPS